MKSILYLSRTADKQSKGIINKVKNTVTALSKEGYQAKAIVCHENALHGSMLVASKIVLAKEDLIILRSDHHTMLVMFLPMLYARLKGQKIIIDVATPVCIAVSEIEGSNSNFFIKKLKKALLYVTFPLSFYPANRVLEYSHESNWFSFGVKRKTKLIGNGVLVESIQYREVKPEFDRTNLNLVGAAHLAYWHGYDRLIRSIDSYNKINSSNVEKVLINFWIIGEGTEKSNLKKLVNELQLEDQVKFYGVKEGNELAECFENIHLGVCSLTLFRKNLTFASELKARDYSARGLPFLLACEDYDFIEKVPFIFQCKNADTLLDLDDVIKWYVNLDNTYEDFSFIRAFAVDKLDYGAKVKEDILSAFD